MTLGKNNYGNSWARSKGLTLFSLLCKFWICISFATSTVAGMENFFGCCCAKRHISSWTIISNIPWCIYNGSENFVLKGIHSSTPVEDIKVEIENLSHEVLSISNIKKRFSKHPLPIFFVSFKQKFNNKDIFNCKAILHTKVSFETPNVCPVHTLPKVLSYKEVLSSYPQMC